MMLAHEARATALCCVDVRLVGLVLHSRDNRRQQASLSGRLRGGLRRRRYTYGARSGVASMTPREITRLWRGGMSMAQIGRMLGVSRQAVSGMIRRHGGACARLVRERQRRSWEFRLRR